MNMTVFDVTWKTLVGIVHVISTAVQILISLCWLTIIKLFYKLWHSKSFDNLVGIDSVLKDQEYSIYGPQEINAVAVVCIRFTGHLDIVKLQQRIDQSVMHIPKSDFMAKSLAAFRKRIIRKFGYYIWEEDPHFSIANHVRLHSQVYDDARSLTKILTDIMQQPYPKDCPPWEVIAIRRKSCSDSLQIKKTEDDSEYYLVFRFHHSLSDGNIIAYFTATITDESTKCHYNDIWKTYAAHPEKISPVVKNNALVYYLATRRKGTKLTPSLILAILWNVFQAIIAIPYALGNAVLHCDKNALHGPLLTGRKILANSEGVDIKLFKDIAAAKKTTINDVLISCIAGAIKKEDPLATSIRTYTAVSGIKPGTFGMQNSTILGSFDISLQDENPIDRLHHVANIIHQFKSSPLILSNFIIAIAAGNHCPKYLKNTRFLQYDGTLLVSSLRCPDVEIKLLGSVAHELFSYPMNFSTTGMYVHCYSK